MKSFFKKYKHVWTLLYALIYFPWFMILERVITEDSNIHIIHCALDDRIPFCEYFIIPYYIWFGFVVLTLAFLFFTSSSEYLRACVFLFTGMTIFLIISTVWPNGITLRSTIVYSDNIFCDLIKGLHKADTSTNVFPSIHVYNSIGCAIAINHSKKLKGKVAIKVVLNIISTLIILSTMFLKQHSVIDVVGAIALAAIIYPIAYKICKFPPS